jgi:hypothetical protein
MNIKKQAIDFEKEYGSAEFCKIVLNVVNKILVEKGITTHSELREKFKKEILLYKSR